MWGTDAGKPVATAIPKQPGKHHPTERAVNIDTEILKTTVAKYTLIHPKN
jgi:hypothetical protein